MSLALLLALVRERSSVASEENKEKMRRLLEEASGGGKTELVDELLHEEAEDLGQEDLIPDTQRINAAGRHLLELINAVLDLSWRVVDQIAEGDKVVSRWVASGTHQGEFRSINPKGKRMR